MPQNNTNLITELSSAILALLLILASLALFYLGKISLDQAISIFLLGAGLLGVNLAYKAPSPTQQNQIGMQQNQLNAQQQNVQQLLAQTLDALPAFARLLHTHEPVPPPAPPQEAPVSVQPAQPKPQFQAPPGQEAPVAYNAFSDTNLTQIVRPPQQ